MIYLHVTKIYGKQSQKREMLFDKVLSPAIADVYSNKFIIPLDFEMLDSAAPYYQAGLGKRLVMS